MRYTLMLLVAAGAVLAATPADAGAQKKSRDRLTSEEITRASLTDQDLFTAIRSLKPHFLETPRGVRSIGGGMQYPLVVYVDGRKASGPDVLVSIRADAVDEVRYLDPTKSQNEYGITANGGAIQVKLSTRTAAAEKKPEGA